MYQDNPTALHLRAMNMLYEGLKEKCALMLVPSTAVESMGMGGMLGAAALRQSQLSAGVHIVLLRFVPGRVALYETSGSLAKIARAQEVKSKAPGLACELDSNSRETILWEVGK